MATLALYKEKYRYLSRAAVDEERRVFCIPYTWCFLPLHWWPEDMMLLFWKKPMVELETFKLVLFLPGSACLSDLLTNPALHYQKSIFQCHMTRWILLSQYWATWQVADKKKDNSPTKVQKHLKNEGNTNSTRFQEMNLARYVLN